MIHEFEVANGLALLPGLIILLVALLFYYQSNRERQGVEGVATAARAEFNRERALELARIVNFGQAIAKLRDVEGLRETLRQHLPQFVGNPAGLGLASNRRQVAKPDRQGLDLAPPKSRARSPR